MNYSIERPPLHKNFWLPSREQLLRIKIGDSVKLIFRAGEDVERMWIIVTKQQSTDKWTGITDNDPYGADLARELPAGTEIVFNPLDIIQIPTIQMRLAAFIAKRKGRTVESYIQASKGLEK